MQSLRDGYQDTDKLLKCRKKVQQLYSIRSNYEPMWRNLSKFINPYRGRFHEEAGTLNGPGIAGLKAAIEWHMAHPMEELLKREHALMTRFYEGVKDIPDIVIYGDIKAEKRAPIITLNLGDYPSSMVSDELSERFQIATRAGAHCAPLMHKSLGTEAQGAVRFSFSHFNTEEEVDTAVRALWTLATEE